MRHLPSGLFLQLLLSLALFDLGATGYAQDKPSAKRLVMPYALVPTDRIRVDFYQEEDLSVIASIDSKGTINLRLVGEIVIAGKSVQEAQKTIETAYQDARILRSPQVTINIEEYAPREASIDGMVRNPGRYPLPIESSLTVADLVSKAGGLTDTARGSAVTVTRIGADGKKTVFTLDVESLIKGKASGKDADNAFLLLPGDIVFVPQRII